MNFFIPRKFFFFQKRGDDDTFLLLAESTTARQRGQKLVNARLPACFTILLSRFRDYLRKWNLLWASPEWFLGEATCMETRKLLRR